MPIIGAKGSPSSQGFGQFAQSSTVVNYIEDVFSTYLYTGNGTSQTITNGIDLSTKGGLVWIKSRSSVLNNLLVDTARGANYTLASNTTAGQIIEGGVTAFRTTGFDIDNINRVNTSAATYASWTWRKQPKFFDIQTWTGDGASTRTISHSLGSVPACVISKVTSTTNNWYVYHRSLTSADYALLLNTANPEQAGSGYTGATPTAPTATDVTVGGSSTNANGATYVAYLFAHNAGGFGLTGTDNVISCSSYTGNGSNTGPIIDLGYEPQWLMIKNANGASNEDWYVFDNARALTSFNNPTNNTAFLRPNSTAIETASSRVKILSTGFQITINAGALNTNGTNYIYIAIRRGPMKIPTTGSSVFGLNLRTGTGANATVTGGAGVTDLAIIKRSTNSGNWVWTPRLTGTGYLSSNLTAVETAAGTTILQANPWDVMDGVKVGTTSTLTNASGSTFINYLLKRAPSFMDIVCYTGTGTNRTVTHNLQAVPELIICKTRSGVDNWAVYSASTGATKFLILNLNFQAITESTVWNNTSPTSTQFTVGTNTNSNGSGSTYVAYLFATCAGVSKVGTFTGNGTTQTINCGFTTEARFILIKRTDSAGDWFVYDTARGINSGNDPYLLFNTVTSEVFSNDVNTSSTGFEIPAASFFNVTGATYIFLAISQETIMQIRIRESGAVMYEAEFRAYTKANGGPSWDTTTTEVLEALGADVVFEGPQAIPTRYQTSFVDGVEQLDGKWYTKYSVAEMDADAITAKDAEQAKAMRDQRNTKLSESDWTQVQDAPVDKTVWATYRQALRDITIQTGFPWGIDWPTQP